MRTSNKVITGIVSMAILVPAIVVATVVIKFRSGSFVIPVVKETVYDKAFPDVKKITIKGLERLNILPANSLHARIDQASDIQVRVEVKGDSLVISGDTSYIEREERGDGTTRERPINMNSRNLVTLYLPAHIIPVIEDCTLYIHANKNASDQSLSLKISNTTLYDNFDTPEMQARSLQTLTIDANNSNIMFRHDWTFDQLNIDLKNDSKFDAGYSKRMGPLKLSLDSTSTINLNGAQYQKIIQK